MFGLPRSPEGSGEVWLLVDSGAGIHACPRSHAPWVPTVASDSVPARTASGAPVKHLGQKTVAYRFEDGSVGRITYEAMEVEKPVLSVGILNASGHKVSLESGKAEIRKGARALRLVEHNAVFYLKARALSLKPLGFSPSRWEADLPRADLRLKQGQGPRKRNGRDPKRMGRRQWRRRSHSWCERRSADGTTSRTARSGVGVGSAWQHALRTQRTGSGRRVRHQRSFSSSATSSS